MNDMFKNYNAFWASKQEIYRNDKNVNYDNCVFR